MLPALPHRHYNFPVPVFSPLVIPSIIILLSITNHINIDVHLSPTRLVGRLTGLKETDS